MRKHNEATAPKSKRKTFYVNLPQSQFVSRDLAFPQLMGRATKKVLVNVTT